LSNNCASAADYGGLARVSSIDTDKNFLNDIITRVIITDFKHKAVVQYKVSKKQRQRQRHITLVERLKSHTATSEALVMSQAKLA